MEEFQKTVWDFYKSNRRSMPWRERPTPYNVFVSEVMLQQTQVPRVLPKFVAFTRRFPDFKTLAAADLGTVLREWSGLGYNRRAKFLWQAAGQVAQTGFPQTAKTLAALPGIGKNTAGAIVAYVYNEPVVFIETNIRTVFIHHFFANKQVVDDPAIHALVEKTLPAYNIREWYWALMDYGTYLKASGGTHLSKVKQYKKQSRFEGSNRQVRGMVIKLLTQQARTFTELELAIKDARLARVLEILSQEGLVKKMPTGHFTI